MMPPEPPQHPIGPFQSVEPMDKAADDAIRKTWIQELSRLPQQLGNATQGMTDSQLDTKYRNWTIRQIVHHLADSHINSYVRFKWTLTEDAPVIKAYDETAWSDLRESRIGSVAPSLQLLEGLHSRWCQLLMTLTAEDYLRSFVHPESGDVVSLHMALSYYVWHGKHHMGQILWLREQGMFESA